MLSHAASLCRPGARLQSRPDRRKREAASRREAVELKRQITRFCVYCGSSDAVDPRYREAATSSASLAEAGIELVFGGGRVGLMGIMADAALAAGGRVVGIIPARCATPNWPIRLTELVIVRQHARPQTPMAERADAFAVLPGGIGTLDETFEMMTWRHLGLHDKPIFLVDVAGYWQPSRACSIILWHAAFHGRWCRDY